jgi:DNA-binding IclR family transcriptional regulator
MRLIRLGETATAMLGSLAKPHLAGLVELTGETSNMAVLEGDTVVYLEQVPGRHAMRMFTEPGRRVEPHCTAVGKAMLAQLPEARARDPPSHRNGRQDRDYHHRSRSAGRAPGSHQASGLRHRRG